MLDEQASRLVNSVLDMLIEARDDICDAISDLCDLKTGKEEK